MAKQTIRETFVLFKAMGTFQGSRPTPNSPYATATPFFSNSILGQQIWPGNTDIESIHHRLSMALNDRHKATGIIGDWRETHDSAYGGFWSYRVERFTRIRTTGEKPQYIVHFTDYQESKR